VRFDGNDITKFGDFEHGFHLPFGVANAEASALFLGGIVQ